MQPAAVRWVTVTLARVCARGADRDKWSPERIETGAITQSFIHILQNLCSYWWKNTHTVDSAISLPFGEGFSILIDRLVMRGNKCLSAHQVGERLMFAIVCIAINMQKTRMIRCLFLFPMPKIAYILSHIPSIQNKWVTFALDDIFLPLFVRSAQTATSCEKQEQDFIKCPFSGVCCFCSFTSVLALLLLQALWLSGAECQPEPLRFMSSHVLDLWCDKRERECCTRLLAFYFSLHQIKRLLLQSGVSLECTGCRALRAFIILLIRTRWLPLEHSVSH